MVWGEGFRVKGLGLGVWDLWWRVEVEGLRVCCHGCGFGVQG